MACATRTRITVRFAGGSTHPLCRPEPGDGVFNAGGSAVRRECGGGWGRLGARCTALFAAYAAPTSCKLNLETSVDRFR